MHGQFIRAVAEGRKLPVAEVTRIADGRIYSGEQALQLKLVDNLGDLQDAIDEACRRGGIKGKPNVVYPPEKKRFLVDLLMEEVADRIAGVAAGDGAGVRSQFGGIRVDAMP
jgi:protease-4